MESVKKWFRQTKAQKMVEVLIEKGYTGIYCDTASEAKEKILELVKKGSTVAVGGSVTTGDMGLVDIFRGEDYKFFERYKQPTWEDTFETYRQSMLADYLVTSTTALTKNGELVNTDSSGNRVGGMIFGPKNVIVVLGANKIVNTIDDAFKRIREVAPMNAKRLGHVAPCVETGICEDCQVPGRICNYTGIIHNGRKVPGRITVIVVAEDLGY